MTTGQKRKLGTAACVGLMIEFADPNGGDKAKKSFVANVSLNKDKNAEATLQHFQHSCSQSPIKEILEDPSHTKLEVTCDNARNYKSKEFVYGATKGMFKRYPHLKLIRWAPLCPCHGKTDLDRRFSSFTTRGKQF